MERLTDENFDEFVNNAKKPVLVDFFTIWCQPCTILSPILESLEEEFKEKISFAQVNVDGAPQTATNLGINQIPTVVLFYKGEPLSGFIGVKSKEEIKEWLNNQLRKIEKEKEDSLTQQEKEIEEVIKWYQGYAEKNGFRLNPDKKALITIIKGLLNNEKKYGARYCPCRRITGNLEEDRPKICPCSYHKQEIDQNGHCHCGLFWKKE